METLLEIFRNIPPGKKCSTVTKNVLEIVSEMGCDYDLVGKTQEIVNKDFEVKLISFPSKEAEERGITKAPAILINRKVKAEGVLTKEEIKNLIERAKINNIGIIITKAPYGNEDPENALNLAQNILQLGDKVNIFLISDGVWVAKKGQKRHKVSLTF